VNDYGMVLQVKDSQGVWHTAPDNDWQKFEKELEMKQCQDSPAK